MTDDKEIIKQNDVLLLEIGFNRTFPDKRTQRCNIFKPQLNI